MNEIYTKLRGNLLVYVTLRLVNKILTLEISRKNINASCSKPEIVQYLYLLILREREFHSLSSCSLSFLGVRSSLSEPRNYIFCLFWRPLWPSALGSRLVRLKAAPALGTSKGHTRHHGCKK